MQDSHYRKVMTDIEAILDRCNTDGTAWMADAVANELVLARSDGFADNEAGDEARWAMRNFYRDLVRRRFGKRINDAEAAVSERQIVLPGFGAANLQERYLVERGGEQVGVIVTDLADAELDALAAMHTKQGRAHLAHAQELRRFKAWRASQASAA